MFGLMRRWSRELIAVISVVSSTVPLFAQGGEEPSSNLSPMVAVGFVVVAIACGIWFIGRSWRSPRHERFLPREQDVTSAPLTGAERTPETNAKTLTATPKSVEAVPVPVEFVPKPDVVAAPIAPKAIAPTPSVPSPAAAATAKSLFVSYRRQDSQHITGRIYDRLSTRFGKESVFKDVDSIPLGFDFRDHLREQVGRCAVLVAVIGKNWNPLSATGQPRLSDPRDHLRIEIESALERQIPVIPVLVDGIEVPTEEELPPSISRLAYYNGIAVRPDPDFHHDLDRLVRGIEQILKLTGPTESNPS